MIIAMTGAGGTGKTTLAVELAKQMELPFYGSVSRIVFKRYNLTEADQRHMTVEDLYKLQEEIFREKVKQDEEVFSNGIGGVFDRTPIDQMAYLLYRADQAVNHTRFNDLYCTSHDLLASYDLVCHMPFFLFDAEDGFREASYGYLQHYHYLLRGIWQDTWTDCVHHHVEALPLDERVQEVRSKAKALRDQ